MQLLFDYGHNFYHWGLYEDIKLKFQTAHKMISERLTYPHQNLKGPKNQGIYSMPPFLKKHIFDHIFCGDDVTAGQNITKSEQKKYLKSGPWNILSNLHAYAHKHVMHCDLLAN